MSRSRKKVRNVRIAAMAATRPISSQLGVTVVCDDVGSELEREPGDEPARELEPDGALCRIARVPHHCAEDPDGGFDGTDRNDEERQRLQQERDVVRGKVQGFFHDLCRRAHDAAETEVADRGIHGLRHARRRPVAPAVVRRAQVRAALHHLSRDANVRQARVVALLRLPAPGVLQGAAGVLDLARAPDTNPSSIPRRCPPSRTARSRSAGKTRPARSTRSRR